jgi:hypothetical protein
MSANLASHVYILGAGRSGTTLLSVLLGAHPKLRARGELLHLPLYWLQDRRCSCGLSVRVCEHWRAAGQLLGGDAEETVRRRMHMLGAEETHGQAVRYLLGVSAPSGDYADMQHSLFAALSGGYGIVDESKYVARALALAGLREQRFRFIYLVRDCRGVLHSFGKNVQEPRSMLSAALYYVCVNAAAQLAVWTRLRGRAMKVRYEDLIRQPEQELARIGAFLGIDMASVIERVRSRDPIGVGHLVSGNRIRSQGGLTVRSNEDWRSAYGMPRRLLSYVLCLPIQLLNRYRP